MKMFKPILIYFERAAPQAIYVSERKISGCKKYEIEAV